MGKVEAGAGYKSLAETITNLPRRAFLATAAGLGTLATAQIVPVRPDIVRTDFSALPPYGNGTIPVGIRSRQIQT